MNSRPLSFYADIASFFSAIIAAISFVVLPWISAFALASATGLNLLMAALEVGEWHWLALLAGIGLGLVCSLTALAAPHLSRIMSFGTLFGGLLISVYFGITLLGMDLQAGAMFLGFGFWLALLSGLVLIFQVFVPREAGDNINVVVGANVNYVVPGPARPAERKRPAAPKRPLTNAWLIEHGTNKQHQLFQDQTRIGRAKKDSDIVLRGEQVSREHALIRETAGQFVIYDRASAHGVQVNGQVIRGPKELEHNDRITLGDVTLQFVKPN